MLSYRKSLKNQLKLNRYDGHNIGSLIIKFESKLMVKEPYSYRRKKKTWKTCKGKTTLDSSCSVCESNADDHKMRFKKEKNLCLIHILYDLKSVFRSEIAFKMRLTLLDSKILYKRVGVGGKPRTRYKNIEKIPYTIFLPFLPKYRSIGLADLFDKVTSDKSFPTNHHPTMPFPTK
ncbi:hypothetical protein BpHYR1_039501 [Brachionus plicatilis]|uniref:Uncharacterized protein n=1 Tax=Brachionus plicatilis TaxID=10195 RepID=A0A3M7QNJ4_BRAPC|nr:hypothetical protein BpHYR1_039501 [Brachionus plicatilis]